MTSAASGEVTVGMAGAGGFEPPVTGPKPAALPLGYAPSGWSAYRRSPAAEDDVGEGEEHDRDEAEDDDGAHGQRSERDDDRDRLRHGERPRELVEPDALRPPPDEEVEGHDHGGRGERVVPADHVSEDE